MPSPHGGEFFFTQPAVGRLEGLWVAWMAGMSLPPGAQAASAKLFIQALGKEETG